MKYRNSRSARVCKPQIEKGVQKSRPASAVSYANEARSTLGPQVVSNVSQGSWNSITDFNSFTTQISETLGSLKAGIAELSIGSNKSDDGLSINAEFDIKCSDPQEVGFKSPELDRNCEAEKPTFEENGNSVPYESNHRLSDLCNTDKAKVARLIQRVIKVTIFLALLPYGKICFCQPIQMGHQNELISNQLDSEREVFQNRIAKLTAEKNNAVSENEALLRKFHKCLNLLRLYQRRLLVLSQDHDSNTSRTQPVQNMDIATDKFEQDKPCVESMEPIGPVQTEQHGVERTMTPDHSQLSKGVITSVGGLSQKAPVKERVYFLFLVVI